MLVNVDPLKITCKKEKPKKNNTDAREGQSEDPGIDGVL
jgi:hypothetical protein